MATNLLCLQQHSCILIRTPGRQDLRIARHSTTMAVSFKVCCSVSAQNAHLTTTERRSANYKPGIGNHELWQSFTGAQADEKYENRVKRLEEQVRVMMDNENVELLTILELIDDIQRLGLGYRFKKDIRRALDRINSWEEGYDVKAEKKLHATALRFRLLRQYGYEIYQDAFKAFIDEQGNFKANLHEDVKGILNLYEASYLAFDGDNLLKKAQTFSRAHLKELEKEVDPTTSKLVSHALDLPLHRRALRLEARWYIETYSQRKDTNYLLLELAKLDYNRVQSLYQGDLKDVSSWWKELDLANNLKFARDRLMESYFWAVGMFPEPQFSKCRVGLTKVVKFITIIDDIYDVYGTLDELELFTDAIERWDINSLNKLPDYMKLCFLALYNTVTEMAYEALKTQGENIIPYLTKTWADLCKAFLQEAKWSYNRETPTFEDYLENAWISSSGPLLLVHSYFLLNQNITKEALESFETYGNLLRWPSTIFRLCNDAVTGMAELERGETASAMLFYMQETGQSEELAREKIRNLIDETWRKMNKDAVDKHPFAEPFVETVINLGRISQCQYQYGDGHGAPDVRDEKRVLSILIDPVSVMEREVVTSQ